MSYLKSAIIGRRRKPSKIGGRGAPARSLRAPSGGPTFYNLPGPTGQKIIDMGFSLGKGVPDMESYFRFLTSLEDAGFGESRPPLAPRLNRGAGLRYWASANHSRPIVNPPPEEIAIATDALWDYTNPQSWEILAADSDGSGRMMPYRMQDVFAFQAGLDQGYCNNNPCRDLKYKPPWSSHGFLEQIPWGYVATVQGSGTPRNDRIEMVKFLRDSAKYWLTLASAGGHKKLSTARATPSGRSTRGLNPLQRKMQRNTFKPSKIGGRGAPARNLRAPSPTPGLNLSQRKGDPVSRSTAMQLIRMGFRTSDGRPDVPAAKKFLSDAFDAGLGQGTPYLMRSAEGIGNTSASFEDRIDMLYGYVGGDINDAKAAGFVLLGPQGISEFYLRKDRGSPLANIIAYGVPRSFRGIASAPSVLASCKQQVPGPPGAPGSNLICDFGIVTKSPSSAGSDSPGPTLPGIRPYEFGLQDREFPWEAIARPAGDGGGSYFMIASPSNLIDYMKDMIKWLNLSATPKGAFGGKKPCPVWYCPEGYVCKVSTGPSVADKCVKVSTSYSAPRPHPTSRLNPLQRKMQRNTFRPKRNRR